MLINNEKWLWPLTRDEQTDVTYSNKGVQQMIINMHEHESQRNSFSHVMIKRKESKSKTFLRSRAIQFRWDQNEERWLWNDEREIHFHCDDRFRYCCCSCLWGCSMYRALTFSLLLLLLLMLLFLLDGMLRRSEHTFFHLLLSFPRSFADIFLHR